MKIWLSNTVIFAPSYFDFVSTYCESITVKDLMKRLIVLHSVSLDTKSAYFVEFNEGDNPYNVRKYSLLQVSQKAHSKYLYIMSLDDFISYCDSLDVAWRRVVWLSHSARCGSTLWGQIFNALPDWGVVSESSFADHILIYERPTEDLIAYSKSSEFGRIAVAGFKFHVSRFRDDQSVLFKTSSLDSHILPHIHLYFTNMTVLHAYRNALPSAKCWYNSSLSSMTQALPVDYMHKRISDVENRREYILTEIFDLYSQAMLKTKSVIDKLRPEGLFEWYLFLWCSFNDAICDAERNGIKVKYLKYESLMEDKETYIRKLFDYLDIHQELVMSGLKVTETDSQADTFFSHESRKFNKQWTRTEEAVRRGNLILNGMGYPDLDGDFVFENTL